MKPMIFEDGAATVAAPLRLRRYDAQSPPDPGAFVNCIVAMNDRTRPGSATLRFSDGSSWLDCTVPATIAPAAVDVTPLIRDAVREALPALLPPPTQRIALAAPVAAPVAAPAPSPHDAAALATAMLELAEMVQGLQLRVHACEQRVEQLERLSVSHVEIKGAAA
jgi:hypothetical protein